MSEKLFKNVNGTRIQMSDEEVKELEDSREISRLEDEAREKRKKLREETLEAMRKRIGISEEEIDILMNGL